MDNIRSFLYLIYFLSIYKLCACIYFFQLNLYFLSEKNIVLYIIERTLRLIVNGKNCNKIHIKYIK
jgi:hypothetical protein